jgi:hypothetical protein
VWQAIFGPNLWTLVIATLLLVVQWLMTRSINAENLIAVGVSDRRALSPRRSRPGRILSRLLPLHDSKCVERVRISVWGERP